MSLNKLQKYLNLPINKIEIGKDSIVFLYTNNDATINELF